MSNVVDVDALVNPARYAKVKLFGRELPIRPLSAVEVLALAEVGEIQDAAGLRAVVRIAAAVLEGQVSPDEMDRMTPEQVGAIIGVARAQIGAVEADAGN